MNWGQMLPRIKMRLGYPTLSLGVTDEVIENFIDIAIETVISKVLRKTYIAVRPASCVKLDKEQVQMVINVVPYDQSHISFSGSSDTKYQDDELSLYFQMSSAGAPTGRGATSVLTSVLSKMAISQLSSASGFKFDWKYDRSSGNLYISNLPVSAAL